MTDMYKFRIKDLKVTLKGAVVRSVKRWPTTFGRRRIWLSKTQWWNAEKLKELQLYLLKRIISHAYETVPYYSDTMSKLALTPDDIQTLEDITKFPLLSKADIKAASDKLVSRKFNKMFLRTAHTGGTTGERLVLKRDLRSIVNEHAFVRRQFDWAGISLADRCAYMMARVIAAPSRKLKKPYRYDAAMKELTLSTFHLSVDTICTFAKAITDYKIKALVAHPSAASILAKGCLNKGIRVPLKAVLTTAETLDSAKKEIISKAFECKVYDFYGSSERVCYIQTCEHSSYHIVPEYGLTELLPADSPNDDCCRIVATGFWNMAMPLIRYDTGDLVRIGDHICQCGRAFPVIAKIVGRESGVLITSSGRIFGAAALEAIMENVLFSMHNMPILECQMIQESFDTMTLEYVPLEGFCQKDADKLRLLAAEHLPSDFKINIRPVEQIRKTVSGKALSLVIS